MLVLAVLALVSANALAETGPPRPSWTHTRALTPAAPALLAEAAQRSSVIRTLLDDLERTDVVVYLSDSMYGSEGEPRAYLTFVTAAAGIRYLLVRIDPGRSLPCERIVWLGHELQHALEIAEAPEVRDADGVRQLYTRIGWEDREGQFETRHARATSDRIRNEMGGHGGGTSPR
jgi:hypothetical protein